jgi:hypothetical protein
MPGTEITMLNSMASRDFEAALDLHVKWGVRVLDLKDCVFGKSVVELDEAEAGRAAEMIRARGLSVYCLSTGIFWDNVEKGESAFREKHLPAVDRALAVARGLNPAWIRLLAPGTERRAEVKDAVALVRKEHPWLITLFREAIDRIASAGFRAIIENERTPCILATPDETLDFFAALDRRDAVHFTWDPQNMWELGAFPTVEVYRKLAGITRYVHFKGGRLGDDGRSLRWASSLEDSSYAVADIARAVVRDGTSPVLCLNPPHGAKLEGYDYSNLTQRDLAFLRKVT